MIIFENDGEIDARAITTFGVHVKEGESPIGFFGTGLKYAIAILLREKQEIVIWSGKDCYLFDTHSVEIRGKEFDMITMNDQELGFTTELGKNWELWMAFRELWCNTVDEGGRIYEVADDAHPPREGKTSVIVRGEKFKNVYDRREEVVLSSKAIETHKRVAAHLCSGSYVFYRGIRVGEMERPTLYTYNMLENCTLTEDRTLRSKGYVDYAIKALVLASDNEKFIIRMLMAPEPHYESDLNYLMSGQQPSETFMRVLGELRARYLDIGINPSAVQLHQNMVVESMLPEHSIKLTTVEQKQYDRAYSFVERALGADLSRFPIIIIESLGPGQLGRADMEQNKMYIARACFSQGTKRVAAALYEEYVHLSERVDDETIEQKWFYLQKILSLGEQLLGEPL